MILTLFQVSRETTQVWVIALRKENSALGGNTRCCMDITLKYAFLLIACSQKFVAQMIDSAHSPFHFAMLT